MGGSWKAFEYALFHDIPMVYTYLDRPYWFLYPEADEMFYHVMFSASYRGLHPFPGEVENIVVDYVNKTVKVKHKSTMYHIEYGKLHVFDDDENHAISGLPMPIERTSTRCEVWDWWDAKSCNLHEVDYIEDPESDFVKHVYFYQTLRRGSLSVKVKDLVSVSYLDESELVDDDFSEINARFKTIEMMGWHDIKGSVKRPGYRGRVNLLFDFRDVNRLGVNRYDDLDGVEFHLSAKSRAIHGTK